MAIDFDAARLAFESFIDATLVGIPVTYENVADSSTVRAAKDAHTPWARVTVKTAQGQTLDIGPSHTNRYNGVLMVQIFDSIDKGTKTIRDTASTISDAVCANNFTNMQIRAPGLNTSKADDWYMGVLTIPFQLNQHV